MRCREEANSGFNTRPIEVAKGEGLLIGVCLFDQIRLLLEAALAARFANSGLSSDEPDLLPARDGVLRRLCKRWDRLQRRPDETLQVAIHTRRAADHS